MSQTAFLREMDAEIFAALEDSGLADQGLYTAVGAGDAVPCTVLIDHDVRDYGDDDLPVSVPYIRVVFMRAQVEPAVGGELVVADRHYRLTTRIQQDESASRWVVEEVRP